MVGQRSSTSHSACSIGGRAWRSIVVEYDYRRGLMSFATWWSRVSVVAFVKREMTSEGLRPLKPHRGARALREARSVVACVVVPFVSEMTPEGRSPSTRAEGGAPQLHGGAEPLNSH